MPDEFRLGSDKITPRKTAEVVLGLVSLIVLAFVMINIPVESLKATTYVIIQLIALIGIAFGFIISKTGVNFNTPIAEEGIIPIRRRYLITLAIIFGLVTFFFISQTDYTVNVPTFQILEWGVWGESVTGVFAAIAENQFFFSLVPGIVFFVFYYAFGKRPWLAVAAVLVITPSSFLVFHTLVYGITDLIASMAVLSFGIEMTVIGTLILRSLTWAHARHLGNNLGILIFSAMSLETFFITILSSIWTYIILIPVVIALFLKFRPRGIG